jgi:branched-chain amino acid transport system substrate-binding protein
VSETYLLDLFGAKLDFLADKAEEYVRRHKVVSRSAGKREEALNVNDEPDYGFEHWADAANRERINRRTLLKRGGAAGAALALAPWVATSRAYASTRTIKIGYVTPRTGSLADFGAADSFSINQMHTVFAKGLRVAGNTYPVQILAQDAQSNSNRAATVAQSLILDDNIDLMLVGGTPDITNPVSDTCEANGVPCISSVAPWQPWFFGRKGNPAKPFKWTYHFFWGLEDIIAVFLDMWSQVPTNNVVGAIWPNDPDGNAWGDPKLGFPPPLKKAGYTIIDPGRYPDGNDDFSSQLGKFKAGNAEIVTGVPIPPDFTTFWDQALQQGFQPKIASVGKALLFPSAVNALGSHGEGMSTELWWSPWHPYKSSLTGQTAAQLAAAWEVKNGEWTQPLGLFEVAADVLRRTANLDDKSTIVDAIKATNLNTIVGHISWKNGPVPNVAKTKLAGAQWRKGTKYKYELQVVSNKLVPGLKKTAKLIPIPY